VFARSGTLRGWCAGSSAMHAAGARWPARTALPRAHQPCTVPLRANTRRSVQP
jgi:hypothetical protein